CARYSQYYYGTTYYDLGFDHW
nr:immunoglobulin heavy chain junction region [Macaca mulatta]MOY30556.1 immunoglobulin heavy chain junction region [Macaca mulatta]